MKTVDIKNTPIEITLEPIIIYMGNKWLLHIPAWFATDGASIPRIFTALDNKKHKEAYVKHDFMYSRICELDLSRKEVDQILREDVGSIEWEIIYIWVRVWGILSWKKDTNYDKYKKLIKTIRLDNWLPENLFAKI